ncbi:hypothetical protein PV08_07102 [Exophiala spinifera]|uniref:U6 snRNA-associated Sm-like protein LSm1 n=1 Tax=Exophiala spinifera TaxID=91928 RepID=A0A0D2B6L3_9EURO|nr:uncharacterized protein PV08_07102 [Exophiala spinifera]KIW14320.1 hypothetical protein PV08_07102 [Exophiala spinifera]
MEKLSLKDAPTPGSPRRGPSLSGPPQGPPQLPPQMFTTAAQLLDLTDKKLMLVLRDGRKLSGILRSWDQFANLVLTNTNERYFVTTTEQPKPRNLYCDVARGTYLVRGENVLLLGEVDLDKDDEPPAGWEQGNADEVFELHRAAEAERKRRDKAKARKAGNLWGGDMEGSGEVLF